MLGICNFSVLDSCTRHCLYILCIVVGMIWKDKRRYRIKAVQMDNFSGLLGIRRINKFSNSQIRENDRIAKKVYIGKCAGNQAVGLPQKRWTGTMKNC